MPRKIHVGDALYFAWKLDTADAASAHRAKKLLSEGEDRNLYRLCSWVVASGEARVLLNPAASLEQITSAIWQGPFAPISSRWIAGKRACAAMAREIENVPVALGLAACAERWPFSSAASE